ncbi:coenzyme F420-reducing hydrogenase beta subunit [Thermosipho japonicus]|uniref:Coenzyme F420-reducing hydrogenase beta subunit n=1 Tax=Thermosipho japonicus TaxID=90323 RepID=A0A841GGK9_9BACT|nr:Coenzyme F420 hydrogenase/dehydrogenase, beta subunit C-terminal domain [Thermosipho japonicus]MBB6062806.1 coenzyme F420-reducing hydrogenase beta subunit [Thermosipho japonicus]
MKNNVMDKIGINCIGCGLCENVCPKKCINITEKSNIGIIPKVDEKLCVNCGACLDTCPTNEIAKSENLNLVKKVIIASSKNKNILMNSSSGGIVSTILYSLFENSKIDAALVAHFDKNLNVYGDFITSKNEILLHSGSYYQTSRMLVNIDRIKKFKSVAFVGLPCHNVALKKFIKKYNLENIYLSISLVCTIGRMKNGLIDFINRKYPHFVIDNIVSYRSRYGEKRPGVIKIKNNVESIELDANNFFFENDYFFVPEGCLNCKKLFGIEYSDISVGDNWGVKSENKIAIVSINSQKGLEMFSDIKKDILFKEAKIEDLVKSQPIGYGLKYSNREIFNKRIRLLKFFYRMLPKNKFIKKLLIKIRGFIFYIYLSNKR